MNALPAWCLRVGIVVVVGFAPTTWGQRARRRPRPPATAPATDACRPALQRALEGLRPALGGCVTHVSGFERGQVRVRVTVDARGTLVGLEVAAHVNGVPNDEAGRCVEGIVRAASFTGCPDSPMSEVEKLWTFAAAPR